MNLEAAITALAAGVVLLAMPAAIRALRIARFHRVLGRHAWRFIIAVDSDGDFRQ